ncbi:MAG: hypothetical protein ACRCZO_18900 [Cetobacterium sp.]
MSTKIVTLENLQYFKGKQDAQNDGKFINQSKLGTEIATLSGGRYHYHKFLQLL